VGHIEVIHGPNLNLLGTREPEIYGYDTLDDINERLTALGAELGHTVGCFQSNHEGAIVDRLQASRGAAGAVVLNAAAYTHTSVAIRDAVSAIKGETPTIEVHLSIPGAREGFRHTSYIEAVVAGRIEGFGPLSYVLALRAASELIRRRGEL